MLMIMIALVLLMPLSPALAQEAPRAAEVPPVPLMAPGPSAASAQAFTSAEAALIRDWYEKHPDAQAAEPVRVAAAKAVSRGDKVSERAGAVAVADELAAVLAQRPGHEVKLLGPAVLLVESGTGVVRDLLRDGAAGR